MVGKCRMKHVAMTTTVFLLQSWPEEVDLSSSQERFCTSFVPSGRWHDGSAHAGAVIVHFVEQKSDKGVNPSVMKSQTILYIPHF